MAKLTAIEIARTIENLMAEHFRHRTFQHYKGGVYHVDNIAFDTELQDYTVLYTRLDGPGYEGPHIEGQVTYARPLKVWLSPTEDGKKRFVPVRSAQVWKVY